MTSIYSSIYGKKEDRYFTLSEFYNDIVEPQPHKTAEQFNEEYEIDGSLYTIIGGIEYEIDGSLYTTDGIEVFEYDELNYKLDFIVPKMIDNYFNENYSSPAELIQELRSMHKTVDEMWLKMYDEYTEEITEQVYDIKSVVEIMRGEWA